MSFSSNETKTLLSRTAGVMRRLSSAATMTVGVMVAMKTRAQSARSRCVGRISVAVRQRHGRAPEGKTFVAEGDAFLFGLAVEVLEAPDFPGHADARGEKR